MPSRAVLIAFSIRSRGRFFTRAAAMAARRRGLCPGSGMPVLAETMISRTSLLKIFAFFASDAFLLCITFFAWECPAIVLSPKFSRYLPRPVFEGKGFRRLDDGPAFWQTGSMDAQHDGASTVREGRAFAAILRVTGLCLLVSLILGRGLYFRADRIFAPTPMVSALRYVPTWTDGPVFYVVIAALACRSCACGSAGRPGSYWPAISTGCCRTSNASRRTTISTASHC